MENTMSDETYLMYARKYLAIQTKVKKLKKRKHRHELVSSNSEHNRKLYRRRCFVGAAGSFADAIVWLCIFPCLGIALIALSYYKDPAANPLSPYYPYYIAVFATAAVVSIGTRAMRAAAAVYSWILGAAITVCRWRQRRIKKKIGAY